MNTTRQFLYHNLEHKIKSAVKSILKECVDRILNEDTNGNVVTLYHGGNENEDPEMYPVYWLTDSKTMALDYAFNNDWPCVYRVTIDTSKLSFENHIEHYDKHFNNAYCLGLRYLTPIINIEPLTEEETNEIEYDLNITEAVKPILKENETTHYEKWYRGYNSKYGSQHDHLLWIADDIAYAREYGNRVEEIIIDDDKLNLVSIYEMDYILDEEIDYYVGPDETQAELLRHNGYQGYEFEAGDCNCICLWDESPIVSRRELTREEFEDIETYDGYDVKGYDDVYESKRRTHIALNENYHGEIYHFTTLPMLYCIVKDNSLIPGIPDQEKFIRFPRKGTRDVYGGINPYLCFTRDKNYNIREGACVYCKLTFDADRLMNLRRARLYPVNWLRQNKINNPSEFEERLYNTDVYPFDKYVERIDIYVKDIAGDMEDGGNDLEDELYDLYAQKYPDKGENEIIAMYRKKMIVDILNDNRLKGKVFVHQ